MILLTNTALNEFAGVKALFIVLEISPGGRTIGVGFIPGSGLLRSVFSIAVKRGISLHVSIDEFPPLVSGLLDARGPVVAPLVKILLLHSRNKIGILHPGLLA